MAEAPTPQAPPPFWRFLAEWLRTRGVTQRDLSKRAGVHETVVSKWLHQDATIRIRPGSRTIPQLAAVLEISTDDLLAMIQADENQLANRRAAARLERSVAESDALDPELVATAAALRDGWPTWDDGFRRAVQTLISGARGRLIDANQFQDWVRSRSMGSRDGAAAERYALRIIKQFSRWLWRRGFFEHDPLARLELPHLPKLHRLPYGELEVRRLLSAAAASSRPTFGRALLLLQFDTGCRIGELCAADVDDVDLVAGAITFRHTKNGQTRRVIFGVDTLPGGGACVVAVAEWLRGRTAVCGCQALFTDVAGERTTWRQAHRYWAQLGAAAGVANPIPHRARHTHASELFAEMPGAELPLRARLGHLSRDVLEAYVTVPERAARHVANIASLSAKWAL